MPEEENVIESVIEPIYDRVTEVLSPFTGIEFVSRDILDPAAERGTNVHAHIEGILKGWDFQVTEDVVLPYVESFKKFWEKSSHAFEAGEIILEKRMFCSEKKITGQVDVIIKCEDRTYLIDWKTSSSPHKSWALQGAAYRYLCEMEGYENVDSTLFVKLSKKGGAPTPYKHENYKENLNIFFKCLELYRYFDMSRTRNKRRD